jgi:glycosyltransferase involved in cell wall biosynthesis
MSRLRLAFIVDHLALAVAGTENQLFKMIPGLAREFDIDLICLRENDWLERQKAYLGSEVRFFEISNFKRLITYRNWLRMSQYLRTSSPDIVHTFFPVSNIVGTLAARVAGVPRIVASRRDFGEWMRPVYLKATRVANCFVDRIVTNSTQVRNLTERVEKYPANRIEVILNGIDLAQTVRRTADAELRRSIGIPEDDSVVVLVGNYRPMKRHLTIVEAAAKVLERERNVSFLLIGGDYEPGQPIKTAVQALAARLGVAAKFFYAQAAEGETPRFLSFADIGVNCSQGEGISNAIMEYMASEIPCVVAASGGNPDLVAHEKTGLLFELEQADQLAAGILRLLKDRALGGRLAAAALEHLRIHMSIPVMVARFSEFYRGLAVPRDAVIEESLRDQTNADAGKPVSPGCERS